MTAREFGVHDKAGELINMDDIILNANTLPEP
jgi:hypothetical protein